MVDHVHKYFGNKHVLKDVSLVVEASEVVAIIGPSGSGKSTLCRCINRLERIDKGTIEIDGAALPEEGKALAQMRADWGRADRNRNKGGKRGKAGKAGKNKKKTAPPKAR